MNPYDQIVRDCWNMIKGLSPTPLDDELDDAARALLTLMCQSVAESERIRLDRPPLGEGSMLGGER